MTRRFASYAHEDFTAELLPRFAAQYEGVDMASLKGATEQRFPFLVRLESHPLGYSACWWNVYMGIMIEMNDDAVEDFALVSFLLDNAYPKFDSFADAEKWSVVHDWPRRSIDDLPFDGG